MRAALGICTKNNEDTIEELLRRIVAQNRIPDEIVFVDSSNDRTPEIIEEFLSQYSLRFRIIEQKGKGVGDARQEIYEYVKDKFDLIVFLDTEKYPINEDWFRNHVTFHTRTDYDILNGRFVERDYEPKSPFKDPNYLIQCNCSIKVNALKKAGGYDRRFKRGEDWDLAIRLYRTGAKSFVSKRVAVYGAERITTKSMIKRKLCRPSSLLYLKKYGSWYLKNYPQHLVADLIGFANLLSLLMLPIERIALITYLLTLLTFNVGLVKSNSSYILKVSRSLSLLLPLVYGYSFLKDLCIYVASNDRKGKQTHNS